MHRFERLHSLKSGGIPRNEITVLLQLYPAHSHHTPGEDNCYYFILVSTTVSTWVVVVTLILYSYAV